MSDEPINVVVEMMELYGYENYIPTVSTVANTSDEDE